MLVVTATSGIFSLRLSNFSGLENSPDRMKFDWRGFMKLTSSMDFNQKSRRIMWVCGRRAKQYKNYGELLYAKGVTMRQNHLKAVYDKKKQNERREAAELTLKPNIRSTPSVCHHVGFRVSAPPLKASVISF